jgi:hypothetical protein
MRLETMDGEDTTRVIGAVVVRKNAGGDVIVDFGPADGPPLVRVRMDNDEAQEFSSAIKAVADGGKETVLMIDD